MTIDVSLTNVLTVLVPTLVAAWIAWSGNRRAARKDELELLRDSFATLKTNNDAEIAQLRTTNAGLSQSLATDRAETVKLLENQVEISKDQGRLRDENGALSKELTKSREDCAQQIAKLQDDSAELKAQLTVVMSKIPSAAPAQPDSPRPAEPMKVVVSNEDPIPVLAMSSPGKGSTD